MKLGNKKKIIYIYIIYIYIHILYIIFIVYILYIWFNLTHDFVEFRQVHCPYHLPCFSWFAIQFFYRFWKCLSIRFNLFYLSNE